MKSCSKFFLSSFILLFFCTSLYAQDKIGLFNGLGIKVKTGLTLNYTRNINGDYVYILQQNARVKEKVENKNIGTVTFVVLFSLSENQKFNFLLNLPFLDYKGNVTGNDKSFSLFNSQTPFGIGFAWFPLNKSDFLGVSGLFNIGSKKRMRPEAIETQFFPIADYPNQNLAVGAPVPEPFLDKYMNREIALSWSAGLIIRL